MAKKTPSTIAAAEMLPADVLKKAKELLTAAERRFFDSSFGSALAKATHEQVQAATKQARILRNKWRDLHQNQTRSAKRTGKTGGGKVNARTQEKHDLFAGAVERLEKRLGDLKRFVTEAVSAPKAAAKPAARKATAAQSARKASPAKAAKKPVKKMVAKTAPTISKKARSAGVLAELAQSPATQAVRLDRAKQRSAVTAAKSGRLKIEGLGARRIGHAAARGRRTQARRDTRPG
jgi:hypothetical protein